MDFYEELGVARSASSAEVRRAYKALARLLHPDQCSDPALRRLAELQMKRLNGMAATLLDPAERLRYDAGLHAPTALARQTPPAMPGTGARRWLPANPWVWPALAAASLILAAWHVSRSSGAARAPAQPREEAVRTTPAKGQPGAAGRPSPRHDATGELLLSELRAARRELEQLRRENRPSQPSRQQGFRLPDPPSEPGAPALSNPHQPPQAANPEAAAPEREEATRKRRFAGNWFYVPGGSQRSPKGLYPPEYVELRLTEDGGRIRGRYRARYRVSDQAISPMVAFDFDGALDASVPRLPWTGPGGAFGEVTLKPVAEDVLEVGWKAHRLSQQVSLASGVAVLLREQER